MNELDKKEGHLRIVDKVLSIEVTTYCNIQCRHCFVNHQISERSSLSFNVVKDIIQEGYDAGYRRLHFTGGEPLLWEGLFEALDDAFFMGYQTVLINTNGTLLSKDVCAKFSKYADVSITVSLDGPQQLHDRIRGEGAYRRTMRGIENAVNATVEPIIFTAMYKSLLQKLPYFAEDLYRKFPKIQYLSLIPLRTAGDNGFIFSKELLEPVEFVQLVRAVSLLNVLGIKIDVLNEPLVCVATKVLQNPFIRWSQPLQQEGNIIIMADRTMSTSHFGRTFFGQYEPGRIKKVLASSEYRKTVSPDESVCPDCDYNQVCRENGLIQPSELHGTFFQNEPFCKAVLDMIVPEKMMHYGCQR